MVFFVFLEFIIFKVWSQEFTIGRRVLGKPIGLGTIGLIGIAIDIIGTGLRVIFLYGLGVERAILKIL